MSSQAQYDANAVAQFEHEAELARNSTAAFREICRNPVFEPCEANYLTLCEYFSPAPISVSGFVAALLPGASNLFEKLAWRSDAQAREAFAEVIAQGAGEHAPAVKEALLAHWRHAPATAINSTAELQRKAEQAQANRVARATPVHELKTIVRSGRQDFTNAVPASLTRNAFAKMTTKEMRKALEIFGATNLNSKWVAEERQ